MTNYQQITIIGHLARDPELTYLQSGEAVCKFSVAVNEKRGQTEHVEWFNVVAWEKLAKICAEHLAKGDCAMFVGSLKTRKYKSKQGEDRQTTDLRAHDVKFISTKRKPGADKGAEPAPYQTPTEPDPLDDVPF